MDRPQYAYIALGSNQGDKFKHLQTAIDQIHLRIGNIRGISRLYQSEAQGFDGADFFNACIAIETELNADKLLESLLSVEKSLGRKRQKKKGYDNRNIDLDLIFFGDEIRDTKTLRLPHPEMHKRAFVLQPLSNIAPDVVHPELQKTVSDLLDECPGKGELKVLNIWLKNPGKAFSFAQFNYIAIEGNIGAGKTSLATKISHDFNAKLILERFADNPFLPKFYEDAARYAFPLEMSFLADRYQQISDDLSQLDLFKDFIISDYDIFKSLIFSKVTLQEDEFNLYRKLFYLMYKDIAKPDLYVYLYQNTERLQENIKKRGRSYEQEIESEYLEQINTGYLDFIKTQTDLKFKIIDISDKDFVNNREDYLDILAEVTE